MSVLKMEPEDSNPNSSVTITISNLGVYLEKLLSYKHFGEKTPSLTFIQAVTALGLVFAVCDTPIGHSALQITLHEQIMISGLFELEMMEMILYQPKWPLYPNGHYICGHYIRSLLFIDK